MSKPVPDYTSKRFGKWLVVKQAAPNKHGRACWLCRCDCGTERVVAAELLRSGKSKSCGCGQDRGKTKRLPHGEAFVNALYAVYRTSARDRNVGWGIDKLCFKRLIKSACFYCGAEPSIRLNHRHVNGRVAVNGIDRVDNNRNYVPGNLVPCCTRCNMMKRELSADEFLGHAERIHLHQVRRKRHV